MTESDELYTQSAQWGTELQLATYQALVLAVLHRPGSEPMLAVGGSDGLVRFWETDLATGSHPPFGPGNGPIRGLAAVPTPDGGQLMAVQDAYGAVELWDPWSGAKIPDAGYIVDVTAGPPVNRVVSGPTGDGRTMLAVAGPSGDIYRWDALTGVAEPGEPVLAPAATALACLGDERGRTLLAAVTSGGLIRWWDGESGAVLGQHEWPGEEAVEALAGLEPAQQVPGAGAQLVVATRAGDGTGRLRIWSPVGGILTAAVPGPAAVLSLAVLPAGPAGEVRVAVVHESGLELVDLDTRNGLPRRLAQAGRRGRPGLVALAGAVLVLVGSLLPAPVSAAGYLGERGGLPVLGSRLGLAGGDGWITLAIGLLALLPAGLLLAEAVLPSVPVLGRRRWLVVLGALAVAWGSLAGSVAPGPAAVLAGGLVLGVAGLLAGSDTARALAAAPARIERLWQGGEQLAAVEAQQVLLARGTRHRGAGDPDVAFGWLTLSAMHARLGNGYGAALSFVMFADGLERSRRAGGSTLEMIHKLATTAFAFEQLLGSRPMERLADAVLAGLAPDDPRRAEIAELLAGLIAGTVVAASEASVPAENAGRWVRKGARLGFGPGRAWYPVALALWAGGFALALAGLLWAQVDQDAAGQAYLRSPAHGSVHFQGSADRPCLYLEEPAGQLSSRAELQQRTVLVVDQATGYRSLIPVTGRGPAYLARVGGEPVVGRPVACWVPESGAFAARVQGGGVLAVGPRPSWTLPQRSLVIGGLGAGLAAALLAGLVASLRLRARRRLLATFAPADPPAAAPGTRLTDAPAAALAAAPTGPSLPLVLGVLAAVAAAGWLAATQAELVARRSPLRSLFVATGDSLPRAALVVLTLALLSALGRGRALLVAAWIAPPALFWLAQTAAHTLVLRQL